MAAPKREMKRKLDPTTRKSDKSPAQPPKRTRFSEQPAKSSASQHRQGHRDIPQASTSNQSLLEEIKALGGDEEDLALIADLDGSASEDEAVSTAQVASDSGLKQELLALTAELGLGNIDTEALGAEDFEPSDTSLGPSQPTKEEQPPKKAVTPQSSNLRNTKSEKQFVFEPRADWHQVDLKTPLEPQSEFVDPYGKAIENLQSHAWSLLEKDAETYSNSVLASSSHKFLSTIMTSGTLSDKVSALTLAVQESPVHNIKAFDALMNLASKKNRGQALGALGALVDLLGPGLVLPPDRRLRRFETQRGLLGALQKGQVRRWSVGGHLPDGLSEACLVGWVYEDWLKSTYFKIIQLLEVWCNDEIEYSRSKSLDFVFALLKDKPEQETNLLTLLVNKLGDRDRKISSRASYLLLQLQNTHPGMKPLLVRAIEQEILLRPGQSTRSKYYAMSTLNQTILNSKDPETAELLLAIYFGTFVNLLKGPMRGSSQSAQDEGSRSARDLEQNLDASDQDTTEKLVSAVLTGINRAVPFVAGDDQILDSHLDTLFRIAHSANFNTSVQALILIQQLTVKKHLAYDRFYRTLYESLLDPRLATSSKQALYLNLLLRSLKADVDSRRVKAFAKRMVQILGLHQPPFACGILYIVLQLQRQFTDLRALLEEPEDHDWLESSAAQQLSNPASTMKHASYDGRKRDPEHSNSQHSCLWELVPVLHHFHPSVSLSAHEIALNGDAIQKPDLESHSLIRFLDKFVYRNPKTTESSRGVSIMQPLAGTAPSGSIWLGKNSSSTGNLSINHPSFWNKKLEHVQVDDIFFHHYFERAGKTTRTTAEDRTTAPAGDVDTENEDEEEIWKALASSHSDGQIEESDGSDLDLDDLDYDSEESADEAGHILDTEDMDSEGDGTDEDDASSPTDEVAQTGTRPESRAERRRKLKDLPTFASVDDYAELLAQED